MKLLCTPLLALLLTSCAGSLPTPAQRGQHMDALASAHDWQKLRLPTNRFVLTAYAPAAPVKAQSLTIYIEGDGLAWMSRSLPSDDPTPNNPLGLELALRHPNSAAAYLGRPCQNIDPKEWNNCTDEYWTRRRFSPEVIEASNQSISALKARASAEQLILVGYSGGAAIAALVAARRQDVTRFVSVAGNLDTSAWTSLHHIEALTGSLNPADEWSRLQNIPQIHFVGGKDSNITPEIVNAYRMRFPAEKRPETRVLPDFNHACCWIEQWPALMGETAP